ncbi:hypothetical protein KIPB_006306 [Kipferlia bialata]|uniref:Protein kinase domain-containing protein n=1 Tax=Kipferlia bialata TaxID=797122 RepID=A0A9K3CWW1_9EUKA|nr:hypothetical protein KIPB_006306 [Kipferlia bialata]|eukprot:g6306.t1
MPLVGAERKAAMEERYTKDQGAIIGRGSFKTVFKAMDNDEGIEVAWNEVFIGTLDADEVERLMSEIKLLKSVSHPNIISLHNWWIADHQLIFITEYMSSGTLRQYIKKMKDKNLNLKVVKKWCLQILEGLVYLHNKQIIHRDIKCDNVFINGNHGTVKIGDLGLSRALSNSETTNTMTGTPQFMPPEMFTSAGYTVKVDVYAFGMLVLEMVTRETPYGEFKGAPFEISKAVTAGEKPKCLSRVRDDDMLAFIYLCIARDPDQRPTAAELLENSYLQQALTVTSATKTLRECSIISICIDRVPIQEFNQKVTKVVLFGNRISSLPLSMGSLAPNINMLNLQRNELTTLG